MDCARVAKAASLARTIALCAGIRHTALDWSVRGKLYRWSRGRWLPVLLALCVVAPQLQAQPIRRSWKAKADFARLQACPSTGKNVPRCPGFAIDHKRPLACGGPDTPANMQWLAIPVWMDKSKWERKDPCTCLGICTKR